MAGKSKSKNGLGLTPTARSFHALAKDYYDETFERFPVHGSSAGRSEFHAKLGRATPAVYARQAKLTRRTLEAVERMPVHEFEGNDGLDRRTLLAALRTWRVGAEEMQTWKTNPQTPLETVAEGIHMLVIRHAEDLTPVAEAVIARMKGAPKYLEEAIECIERPEPLWLELARGAAGGVRSLMESLPAPLAKATGQAEAKFKRIADRAADAVRRYSERLGEIDPGDEGGFALGTARFEAMMRERLGLNLTAREAAAAAEGLAERLQAELATEAKRFHPRKRANEILEEAAAQWEPEGRDLLGAYRKQTRAIRAAFRKAGAMTFPRGDKLLVRPVPEFMRQQFPTAAYSSPGALDPDQTGIFWVNDLSQIRDTDEARRAEIAQHFGIELTAAHEAYPGHHLQFIIQNRHPSLVRKLADHAIYYEGWTLWCEQMSVDLKVSDNPYLRLIQLNDALWRANRIVIDCGLQTGAMTHKQACRRLQREVGFTQARARADVNWYTSSPTVPMSYLLGKMELVRLKRQRVDRGGWTLKQFNDWALGFGAIPWSWIEASGL